ncbi:hypothetical protein AAVH_21695 [Aphelenchoides avenae]|nr:hypothetical protein AAVH_21695 [Aphelenchus avenae]
MSEEINMLAVDSIQPDFDQLMCHFRRVDSQRKFHSVSTRSKKQYKKKKTDKISSDKLHEIAAKFNDYVMITNEFKCPICGFLMRNKKDINVNHVLTRMNGNDFHPYKCPVHGCTMTSLKKSDVLRHIANFHKLEWNDSMKYACIDEGKISLKNKLFNNKP